MGSWNIRKNNILQQKKGKQICYFNNLLYMHEKSKTTIGHGKKFEDTKGQTESLNQKKGKTIGNIKET